MTQGRERKTASRGKNRKKKKRKRGRERKGGKKQGRRGIINNSIETDKGGLGTNPLKVLQKTLNFPLLWVESLIHFPLESKGQGEDFLVVQWLELHTVNAGGLYWIPGQ